MSVLHSGIHSYIGMRYNAVIDVDYEPIKYVTTDDTAWVNGKEVDNMKYIRHVVYGVRNDSAYPYNYKIAPGPSFMSSESFNKARKIVSMMSRVGIKSIIYQNDQIKSIDRSVLQVCRTTNMTSVFEVNILKSPVHTIATPVFWSIYNHPCVRRLRVSNTGSRNYSMFTELREIIFYLTVHLYINALPKSISHLTVIQHSNQNFEPESEMDHIADLNIHYLYVSHDRWEGAFLKYIPSSVKTLILNLDNMNDIHLESIPKGSLEIVVLGSHHEYFGDESMKIMTGRIHINNPQAKVYSASFSYNRPVRASSKHIEKLIKRSTF